MAAVLRGLRCLVRPLRAWLLLPVVAAAAAAAAQTVVLAGRMGDRALLVVDGEPHTVAVGDTAAGVRFVRWVGEDAEVQSGGVTTTLRWGGAQAQLGAPSPRTAAREVAITAGPGGHYTAAGAINGKPVQFMVDTGATLVSLGRSDAQRLGIDLNGARVAMTQTANGAVPVLLVVLNTVRIGELELANVGAAVVPQEMPLVLLGNSFLARVQMRRDNNVMRLEIR